MNLVPTILLVAALPLAIGSQALFGEAVPERPVTPDASPEAAALLQLLYDISGRYILTGQHNMANTRDTNTEYAAKYIGKTPIIFGMDMGFAKAGDKDNYLARADNVQEAIRQHRKGSLIAICWHAVPPTADEPVTFRPLPHSDPGDAQERPGAAAR